MGKTGIVLICLLVALSVLASGYLWPKQDPNEDRDTDTGIKHNYDNGSGLTVSGTDQCTHYSANESDVQHHVSFNLKNEGEKTISWDRMFIVFDCGIVDEDYVIIVEDKLGGSLAPGEMETFEYFSGSDTAKLIKASASGKLGLRVSLYKDADGDWLDEIFHKSAMLPRITPFKDMSEELVSPQKVSLSFTDDREAVTHQILKES